MTHTLRLVPARTDTRRELPPLLRRLWQLACDAAYGVHAGNAIRHGLPAPRRPGVDVPDRSALRPVR